jgi:hemerythrin
MQPIPPSPYATADVRRCSRGWLRGKQSCWTARGSPVGLVDAMKTYGGFFGNVPVMQHSLASLIQWDDHLSTDDPALDAQERAISKLVGEIDELWCRGASVVQFGGVADRASHILEAHFRYEERMLAAVGYPDLTKHAAEHHEILEDLASIRVYLNGSGESSAAHAGLRLSNFILGLTLGHILNTDSVYIRYIVDETAKLSTGCA